MKTIIISDIKGKNDSIIPFGLNLAKSLHSEVDILHTIDSRTLHGVQSPYSDSQTIVPGKKLTHREIVDREKKHAEMELDKILSKEASKLNYPLKVNTVVEDGSIAIALYKSLKKKTSYLVVANSEHDGFIFHSRQEIIEILGSLNAVSLVVPPAYPYNQIKNVLLVPGFTQKDIMIIKEKISFLKDFKPVINAVVLAKKSSYKQKKLNSKIVETKIKDRLKPFNFELNILTGNKYTKTIIDYINKTKPDLVLMLTNKKSLFKKILQKKRNGKLLKNINSPVLLVK